MADLTFEQKERIVLDNLKSIETINARLAQLSTQIANDLPNNKKLFEEFISQTRLDLARRKKELENAESALNDEKVNFTELQKNTFNELDKIAKEKSQGFPWVAKAYADYFYLQKLKFANYLDSKKPPAPVEAGRIRQVAKERKIIEEKLRVAQNIINYYQELFPFLEEFLGDTEDEILEYVLSRNIEKPIRDVGEIGIDPVRIYLNTLSPEEYQKLSTSEKNQRALDIYWSRPKNKWQVGKDYERYIGYLFEMEGYSVYYQGILEGYDDLGRDLVCKTSNKTLIVQCKRWSQNKTIHEKHINQLYGTVAKYKMDHRKENVIAMLYTTTTLSERAKEFANYLQVRIFEAFPIEKYPCIKCNISTKTSERIYHLPFDQQYDRTIITEERNECYVETIAEAEKLGFRRAFRWHGDKKNESI